MRPVHARYAVGYACTCLWAVVLILSPIFGSTSAFSTAPASMLPGLAACLASVVLRRSFPSMEGRTWLVTLSAFCMAGGTLLCTYPTMAENDGLRLVGLFLSGFFAVLFVMSWFEAFSRLSPRVIIAVVGCTIAIASAVCWLLMSCTVGSVSIFVSLLPMVSYLLLPSPELRKGPAGAERRRDVEGAEAGDDASEDGASEDGFEGAALPSEPARESASAARSLLDVVSVAVPVRTMVGLAITFFIISSVVALAPAFGLFSIAVSPFSLAAPFGVALLFVLTARLVRHQIDSSILFKILLALFGAGVFLIAYSTGISAPLVFFANIIAEAMMWIVLSLWAKKTPVEPRIVFAIGWIAECVGVTAGRALAPVFAGSLEAFFAVAVMLIIVAVGFAFSEGSLMLDVDFRQDEQAEEAGGNLAFAAFAPIGGALRAKDGRTRVSEEGRASGDGRASDGGRASEEGRVPEAPGAQGKPTEAQSRPVEELVEEFSQAYGLSRREKDVFALWVTGHGLKRIESDLFISESTVKTHLRNIYRKCDTHNRDEIIALFERESGLSEQR